MLIPVTTVCNARHKQFSVSRLSFDMETAMYSPVHSPEAAVTQAMLGDPAGFQMLYDTYKSYVYSLCVRMTRNPTLAEDLTQDVFFRVWRRISSFQGNSQFRTWLHRVTVNTVLMHFRQRKRRIDTVSLEESILPESEREPSTTSQHLEDQISLRTTIRRLAPGHRRILTLHEIEGYRHEDISHLLGITSGASKSQLHKARLRLSIALGAPKWPLGKNSRHADAEARKRSKSNGKGTFTLAL
jgi:RNA polymerase sigma-70 factor (ECF subfamily)